MDLFYRVGVDGEGWTGTFREGHCGGGENRVSKTVFEPFRYMYSLGKETLPASK